MALVGTAFLVPNTIATVFGTPIADHLGWQAQLWIVVISTLVSVFLVYWVMKRKGLFPKMEQ